MLLSFTQVRHDSNAFSLSLKHSKRLRKDFGSMSSSVDAEWTVTSVGSLDSKDAVPFCDYKILHVPSPKPGSSPQQDIFVVDLTCHLRQILDESKLCHGVMHITSRHTTTAITVNEYEKRLAEDLKMWLQKLAPPDERSAHPTPGVRYLHNDIDERPDSDAEAQRCRENGWDIDDVTQLQAWRNQEPINAHSHLGAMLLGSHQTIPVVNKEMTIGQVSSCYYSCCVQTLISEFQWQSVLLVDLDGPRERTVGIQLMGFT